MTGVAVIRVDRGFGLYCAKPVPEGEWLFSIEGEVTSTPSRYSVQIGRDTHVDLGAEHSMEEIFDRFHWRFINHSCEPNVVIRDRDAYSLRPIGQWEELFFDYNTTEWDLAEPFDCRCGTPACVGLIRGFRHLPAAERDRRRPLLAPHLLDGPA